MAIIRRLLIANRGEVAIRIIRAAVALGIETVAVCSVDDANAPHTRKADMVRYLDGTGPAAYLDQEQIVNAALSAKCDAIHPGYGFLAENAGFAERCRHAGVRFVGPHPEVLGLFGDKSAALDLARRIGVPVIRGTEGPTTLDEAKAFMASLSQGAAVMIKAVSGGGGRGMRRVESPAELDAAFERCRSEARVAFGRDEVYVEQLLRRARHIEVQVAGDATGAVVALGERDCSVQRRNQKLIEIAPSPYIDEELRQRLAETAVRLGHAARLDNLATVEFLVNMTPGAGEPEFTFIECNPRLQVEHTVTEQLWGIDLVAAQLQLAGGATLAELELATPAVKVPRGWAVQLRINGERMLADGSAYPSSGMISTFEMPSGAGIRVDTAAAAGYTPNPRFDSLLAKLIVHWSGDFDALCRQAYRVLCETHIEGLETNIPLLQRLLLEPHLLSERVYTSYVDEHLAELLEGAAEEHPRRYAVQNAPAADSVTATVSGARIDQDDPLAVLAHGKSRPALRPEAVPLQDDERSGSITVRAPMQGTIVSVDVSAGDRVAARQQIAVMDAMKMEHLVSAPAGGVVERVLAVPGETLLQGQPIAVLHATGEEELLEREAEIDLELIRPDLQQVLERRVATLDPARPKAIASRHAAGRRTVRENIADLVDEGTFVEYGQLVLAAQRRTRTLEDLIARTPADGLVTGIGTVNGGLFGPTRSRCAVLSYDYTVLAGTQGQHNHRKHDRMFELAAQQKLPVIFFTEGGGGRNGDTDGTRWATMRTTGTFRLLARLSGLVPLVAIASGLNFAGNAAIAGACDVVIATPDTNIGMGGPAVVEGGGLGVYRPDEIGPASVHVANGVIDVLVRDHAEAVATAKKYVSYFQGDLSTWERADQRRLRQVVPENRRRTYEVRRVIETLVDSGSCLELRPNFGRAMVTALARVEGKPIGIIANNAAHLSGAIDSDAADKAARFLQLCDAFAIPILSLCDTPGIMVGPEVEKTALVRHCNRLFVVGANLSVPLVLVVLRKAVGLGAMAMCGGNLQAPALTVAWPTGEFSGMGIEGSIKLGHRAALQSIQDIAERKAHFDDLVARAYADSAALNQASLFEIDDVIDPADTRNRVAAALAGWEPVPLIHREGKRRPCVDTW